MSKLHPTTAQTMTHGTLLTAVLAAVIVSGWKVSAVLNTLNSWDGIWQEPKLAGDLLQAFIWGLIALALGLGLNISTLLRGIGIPVPQSPMGTPDPPEPLPPAA